MDRLMLDARGLDLAATLLCGQSFSWRALPAGGFAGVAGRRAVQVWQTGENLCLENLSGTPFNEEDRCFWRNYFALDTDYAALQRRLCRDATLARCVAADPGIRVLRQPFFETLLAFILSQNSNIPRITGMVGRLREGFGEALAGGEHAFPTPERLAVLEPGDLAELGAGYRDKYLIYAARKVASGVLDEEALRAMPTADARTALLEITGVGPKVADCVLLFGLGRSEVAPMDVWMKRALARHFGGVMPACAAGAEGIAQQYIFAWARRNIERGAKNENTGPVK